MEKRAQTDPWERMYSRIMRTSETQEVLRKLRKIKKTHILSLNPGMIL